MVLVFFTGHCNQVLPLIYFILWIDFYTSLSLVFCGFYDSIRNLFIKVSPLSVRLWVLLCTVLHITMQYTSSMQEKNPWDLTQSTVFLPGGLNFLILEFSIISGKLICCLPASLFYSMQLHRFHGQQFLKGFNPGTTKLPLCLFMQSAPHLPLTKHPCLLTVPL